MLDRHLFSTLSLNNLRICQSFGIKSNIYEPLFGFSVQEIDDISVNTSTESTTKTLPKYVPLFDASGNQSVILLPGRHLCDCQATRHKLIRNCLSCGRIVCEQERAGPCLFCGDFVASREEVEAMKRVSQKGKKIYENIMKVHNIYLKLKGSNCFLAP